MRLDYVFVPDHSASRVAECAVVQHPAAIAASDHLPVIADLAIDPVSSPRGRVPFLTCPGRGDTLRAMSTTVVPRTSAAPGAATLNRRELLTAAGAGAAALLLDRGDAGAQPPAGRAVVFANTSVVTVDGTRNDVALAVDGGVIAAIGPTDQILKQYPQAEVYNGRGKALFPGLINCHAHLGATIARGFNEDFGFPNSYRLAVQPGRLLSRDEDTLMAVVGALEAIRTGSTTVVENVGNIGPTADQLAKTGLRWVFAESATDREGGSPMTPEILAKGEAPRFSPKMRDDGLQRISDLHSAWHGKLKDGSACSPPPDWPRTRRPNCCARSARSLPSTTSATPSTCRRAGPKSPTCRSTTA